MTSSRPTPTIRPETRAALFLELAKPDELGFSRSVSVDEFVESYDVLRFGNGGSWIRRESKLAQIFNIRRHPEKGPITHVELQGFRKVAIKKPIPPTIQREIASKRCAVLATGSPQCDHRDGRLDDPRLSDASQVVLADFQPLSQAANSAKRQHCAVCRDTGKRFDATQLGYCVGQVRGNGDYNGTCVGCYWHNPHFFNGEVSRGYRKR